MRLGSYQKGVQYELFVIDLLRSGGYEVLEHRYKTPFGEVDIIALKEGVLVFCEVKYRHDGMLDGYDQFKNQASRIMDAAQHYLVHRPCYNNLDLNFNLYLVDKMRRLTVVENFLMDCM